MVNKLISIGIIASTPYVNEKEVSLIDPLGVVW